MKHTLIVLSACSFLILSACSEKNPVPKTPENILKTAGGADNIQRQFVANADYGSSFQSALDAMSFYSPDNCLQVVNLRTKAGVLIAQVLEMSAVPCPGTGLVDAASVITQFEMVPDPYSGLYFELRTQVETNSGLQAFIVGDMGRIDSTSGSQKSQRYEVRDLCTNDYEASTCFLEIENSLFKSIYLY